MPSLESLRHATQIRMLFLRASAYSTLVKPGMAIG